MGNRRVSRRSGAWVTAALVAGLLVACVPASPQSVASPSPDDTTMSAAPSVSPTGTPASASPQVARGLAWSDEFDSDLDRWSFDVGAHGWWNGEQQFHTDRETNSFIEDGVLHIVARQETGTDAEGYTAEYTSARLVSADAFRYGRVEGRINTPAGGGLWSAFWLLGVADDDTWWPMVGEIDIVEVVNEGDIAHQTVWGNQTGSEEPWRVGFETPAADTWSDEWHVYAVEWTPTEIVFFVDDTETGRVQRDDQGDDNEWSFDRRANIILNLSIGGQNQWPGPPNPDTYFPAVYQIDWVRVYDSEVYPGE